MSKTSKYIPVRVPDYLYKKMLDDRLKNPNKTNSSIIILALNKYFNEVKL